MLTRRIAKERPPLWELTAALFLAIAVPPTALGQTRTKLVPDRAVATVTSLTTDERIYAAPWWPTKGESAASEYAGEATCAQCHSDIVAVQHTTPMYHAASSASRYALPSKDVKLVFQEGPFTDFIERDAQGIRYSVASGARSSSMPVAWAFGNGETGQTFLLRKNNGYVESRLSYYTSLHALDITTGHSAALPSDIGAAFGHELSFDTTQRCFSCHTTASTLSGAFTGESAVAGVTCEACHGPGAKHVATESDGHAEGATASITNPMKLSPADSVDFCGACHRTFSDVTVYMPTNLGATSVRFQPYRLEKSRCWGVSGDARITCIACHDPHLPLEKRSALYDPKCLACHTAAASEASGATAGRCTVATANCVSCHMPKVQVPGTHSAFTDHYIRVVTKAAGQVVAKSQ